MKRNIIADKLEQLYKKEGQIYANPVQTRPKPKAGITGQQPDDEALGPKLPDRPADEEEVKKDLGLKGSEKDLGLKGTEKDLGRKKRSEPKEWEFEGPREAIRKED